MTAYTMTPAPRTRQGLRDLNSLGPRPTPARELDRRPPCLPGEHHWQEMSSEQEGRERVIALEAQRVACVAARIWRDR